VRAEVPRGVPVGARITGTDWVDGGLTVDDAVVFARELKAAAFDYVDVSSGAITAESQRAPTPGFNVPFAEKVRREVGMPTRTVGLIAKPHQAEAIVAEGKADMVALARAFLDDPHWGWHAAMALNADVSRPKQYLRAAPKYWPAASYRD
jgi:NADPH2 dehydrogenase